MHESTKRWLFECMNDIDSAWQQDKKEISLKINSGHFFYPLTEMVLVHPVDETKMSSKIKTGYLFFGENEYPKEEIYVLLSNIKGDVLFIRRRSSIIQISIIHRENILSRKEGLTYFSEKKGKIYGVNGFFF